MVDPADDDGSTAPTFDLRADNIVLDGFLLAGNENSAAVSTSPTSSGYRIYGNRLIANAVGMFFHASGDNPSVVQRNAFRGNNENLGVAAAAGNAIYSDQGLHGALIQSNQFRNNINGAVLLADNASGVTVQQNKIYNSIFSGIRISSGAIGVSVISNVSNGNGDQGISVSAEASGAVTVRSNTTNANNGDGILFSAATRGNVIRFNNASGNGDFDCKDRSSGSGTAGTANLWSGNHGAKSSPAGLCVPRR